MNRALRTLARLAPWALAAAGLTGCGLLVSSRAPAPSYFTLKPVLASAGASAPGEAPTLIAIAPTEAGPGLEGPRMAYVTRAFELRYFTRHQWVEPPARLLPPLLVLALERGGRFRPVQARSGVVPALRLETEIVAFQQEFDVRPSQLRFGLRVQLVDAAAGQPIAEAALEALEPAASEDPYGGVVAANRAVARVLEQLAAWCDAQAPRGAPAR